LKVGEAALEAVRAHAEEGYPDEVCGVLVGPSGRNWVSEARRARNTITDRARDRYEIDPLDQIRIQRECDASGLDVLGYYHSHPDHPARPSVFDTERAWASTLYVIVSVVKGRQVDVGGFVADQDGGPFRPEPLVAPGD
jgi:proteasome lid subunit RPN8/RPN11